MIAAAATPTPATTLPPVADTQSAVDARKRRVELLKMTRAANSSGDEHPFVPCVVASLAQIVVPTTITTSSTSVKKRRVSDASSVSSSSSSNSSSRKKRPTQMRYDPEVPMTKEEAAAWRREARRVRNRQSAAASRQKTRDRIEELEAEVDCWQLKFAELEAKVRAYEVQNSVKVVKENAAQPQQTANSSVSVDAEVSDSVMASAATLIDLSPVLSAATKIEGDEGVPVEKMEQHLNMISRPAVKIADVVSSSMQIPPLLPDLPVVSVVDTAPNVVIASDASTDVITDEEDLDEFLMDAFGDDMTEAAL